MKKVKLYPIGKIIIYLRYLLLHYLIKIPILLYLYNYIKLNINFEPNYKHTFMILKLRLTLVKLLLFIINQVMCALLIENQSYILK